MYGHIKTTWMTLKSAFFTSKHIKNSYKHIPGNECFLSLIERLHSTKNALTIQYFTYSWYNTFTIHVSSLITVEF